MRKTTSHRKITLPLTDTDTELQQTSPRHAATSEGLHLQVVLNNKNVRQLVQRGHVQRLVELTHVAGAVSKERASHAVGSLVTQYIMSVRQVAGMMTGNGGGES